MSASLSLDDFKNRLKKENVLVKTGRGINFIDGKQMMVKGSDLKFPIAKITASIKENLQVHIEKEKQMLEEQWKDEETIKRSRSRGFRM